MSRIEDLLKEIDEMQFPFHVDRGVYETILTQEQTETIIRNIKEALALLAEQPKADEFMKTLDAIQIYFDDDCRAFLSEWYDFKKLWKEVRCHIDRLEREKVIMLQNAKNVLREMDEKGPDEITDPVFSLCAMTIDLQTQLATKDENVANLQEQLIKMCRVFHSIDCVCKWCNIAKERAVAST